MASTTTKTKKKSVVVVVGASFAGQKVAKQVQKLAGSYLHVVTIDAKGYFEYYPSTLRCMVEPSKANATVLPLEASGEMLVDEVLKIALKTETENQRVILASGREISFDYVVIATGSTYSDPIKTFEKVERDERVEKRREELSSECKRIEEAESIVVLGGGPVGVELAAELAGKFRKTVRRRQKRITLCSKSERLLPQMHRRASDFAEKWLRRANVDIRLGTNGGKLVDGADIVYRCFGSAANASFECELSQAEEGKGFLVRSTMQSVSSDAVFVVGDAACCETSTSEKTAFSADVQALVAARNIAKLACESKEPLDVFPESVCHGKPLPLILCISLYKYSGTFQIGSLVINGYLASVMKNTIEYFQLQIARNGPIPSTVWGIFERITLFLF